MEKPIGLVDWAGGLIWKTFEGENLREFRGFVAIRESFLCKIWGRGIH